VDVGFGGNSIWNGMRGLGRKGRVGALDMENQKRTLRR
jgi:hypothetical protein